jgi:hypothetical protein
MLHELSRHYPDMAVETLETPEHTFNLLNRDQSTPLLKPDKWNADTLIIDTWKKNIYIKGEFIPEYYNAHINPGGVPRLLLGWMARVCCQVLLFAWCERWVRLLPR